MIIAVYGAGYVGLITAAGFANLGYQVICADIDKEKIALLSQGKPSIYEEGLPELLEQQLQNGRLLFTNDLPYAMQTAVYHIIAVGTPSRADGSADLSAVYNLLSSFVHHINHDGLVIIKSTVPVGTGDSIEGFLIKHLQAGPKAIHLEVASNPEFLREGRALFDFFNPERIIVGGNKKAHHLLKALYQPFIQKNTPFLSMSRRSAELTKYAANAMLACRISFINYLSQIAEEVHADIHEIQQGISLDSRIGPYFLHAGIGYGGSCFPKDIRALVHMAEEVGINSTFLKAIEEINHVQKNWVFKQLNWHFKKQLRGLRIGIWGVAFKPDTDDIREASSLIIIQSLLERGAEIFAFDPNGLPALKKQLPNTLTVTWCEHAEAIFDHGLDALVIATEWQEFKSFPLARLRDKLQGAPLFDGRNCYELTDIRTAQIPYYYSVGRPLVSAPKVREKEGSLQ